ncbi:IucA/IucC family protein [Phytomonospora sp. NPDC050363]|uniref:IucA/IucC family protein n=1 Tax=Phytomonospora sp. NPDC050363 TaxID=3155642 RepID=UPI0033E34669
MSIDVERLPDGLRDSYREHLPAAAEHVRGSVLAAAWREDIGGLRTSASADGEKVAVELPAGGLSFTASGHAFDQVAPYGPIELTTAAGTREVTDPVELLDLLGQGAPATAEVADAAANLALGLARRAQADPRLRSAARDLGASSAVGLAGRLRDSSADFEPCLFFERLATFGHHLHPCARTRLGMDTADLLAHDLEGPGAPLRFVAVRADRVRVSGGVDPVSRLRETHPLLDDALNSAAVLPGEVIIPIHPWQYESVIRRRYSWMFAAATIRDLPDVRLAAAPTISLRTLVTGPGDGGRRWQVKCALDVQITSTRRTISAATAHNGPSVSAELSRIVEGDPLLAGKVGVLPEVAGVSMIGEGSIGRDFTSVLRAGIGDVTGPGELPVPGCALSARSPIGGRSVLGELVGAHGAGHMLSPREAAADFLERYAALLVPPVLRLAALGVGLEAHLQNTIPVFVDGTPVRMLFRDWGGARLHVPRMRAAGHVLDLFPGSVVATDDLDTMRAKVAYTTFQSHLAELIRLLAAEFGLPETAGWGLVRRIVAGSPAERSDLRFLTAVTQPHKALLTMRTVGDGDRYIPVANPLYEPAEGPG